MGTSLLKWLTLQSIFFKLTRFFSRCVGPHSRVASAASLLTPISRSFYRFLRDDFVKVVISVGLILFIILCISRPDRNPDRQWIETLTR
jgi:hypothetical protein